MRRVTPSPQSFIACLLDDIHLNFADLAQVRDGAGRNIDASWPIDHMAIFTTSGQGDASTPERRDHRAAAIHSERHAVNVNYSFYVRPGNYLIRLVVYAMGKGI
jgi:hypothetical protein